MQIKIFKFSNRFNQQNQEDNNYSTKYDYFIHICAIFLCVNRCSVSHYSLSILLVAINEIKNAALSIIRTFFWNLGSF